MSYVKKWSSSYLIMLENTPLNVALLAKLRMPINPGALEPPYKQAGRFVKHLKPMLQFSCRNGVPSIDWRI
jgi:hypothetical protein